MAAQGETRCAVLDFCNGGIITGDSRNADLSQTIGRRDSFSPYMPASVAIPCTKGEKILRGLARDLPRRALVHSCRAQAAVSLQQYELRVRNTT
jgi:hypothetical protein